MEYEDAADWEECPTAEGGIYYFNRRTRESRWERPRFEGHFQLHTCVRAALPPRVFVCLCVCVCLCVHVCVCVCGCMCVRRRTSRCTRVYAGRFTGDSDSEDEADAKVRARIGARHSFGGGGGGSTERSAASDDTSASTGSGAAWTEVPDGVGGRYWVNPATGEMRMSAPRRKRVPPDSARRKIMATTARLSSSSALSDPRYR